MTVTTVRCFAVLTGARHSAVFAWHARPSSSRLAFKAVDFTKHVAAARFGARDLRFLRGAVTKAVLEVGRGAASGVRSHPV